MPYALAFSLSLPARVDDAGSFVLLSKKTTTKTL